MSNLIASRTEQEKIRKVKELLILSFLLDEGYSTLTILALLLTMTPNGTRRILQSMEAKQLIKAYQVAVPLNPRKVLVWGLTPTGAAFVTPDNEPLRFFEVGRIKPITMDHSLALQRIKAIGLRGGWGEWNSSSKMLRTANEQRFEWLQVPDSVAISPQGRKVAIELERRLKTPKRYVEILANYAEMLTSEVIQEVFYVCPNELVTRVEREFYRIETIIFRGKIVPVHESLLKRFSFISYTDWEVRYVV